MSAPSGYEVGSLVRWVRHEAWDYSGLGIIVERHLHQVIGWKYRIMWHVDIQDITDYKGMWYNVDDFACGDIVAV